MIISEQKVRISGYLAMVTFFFVFFMLEMFFSWRDEHLLLKVIFLTVSHTFLLWEPVRAFILRLRLVHPGLSFTRRRLVLCAVVLIPYATGIGFLRIYAEDRSNLWGVPVASFSSYSYTIGISLLFTLLQVALYEGLFFFNEWVKAHQEREELQHLNVQMQLEALKVQVQPHFLFNTINTLVSLIEKDQERAVHFAESLSDVYRYFLQANQTQLINLEKEIQFCEIYFSLLKTRFPDGLYLHNFLNGCSYYELPPLTIQSLIENAVKHNVISASRSLHITIDFLPTTQRIIVTNNLQPRVAGAFSGKGLQYITEKFRLLNLPPVSITKDEKLFSVSFPIIKTYAHESYDH